jgi:opacity protein-like surface antigen
MKLMIAALALATLVASPALAQDPQTRAPKARHAQTVPSGANHYGRTEGQSQHSTSTANDVYDSAGRYVGSDPDARIRLELLRDRTDY